MKKIKKIIILLIMLISLFSIKNIKNVKADSGWDTSYGGGSYDSGSSYSGGSSSDWSSSSSSSSSGSYSSGGGGGTFDFTTAIFMELFVTIHYIVFVFVPISKMFKKYKSTTIIAALIIARIIFLTIMNMITIWYAIFDFVLLFILAFTITPIFVIKSSKITNKKIEYDDLRDDILKEYGIDDKEKLKQELFNKYVDIQNAWMDFEYDKLKELCNNSIYNTYKQELEVLEMKKEKNIMRDFEYIDSKIYDISKNNDVLILKLYLNVKMYDYVVDEYNKVIKGSSSKKMNVYYEMIFEKSLNKTLDTCPNCGSKIESGTTKCSNCKAVIVQDSNEFVLSKKRCVRQN